MVSQVSISDLKLSRCI